MDFSLKEHLEKVFRESSSPGELFDMFQKALELKLADAELYKILLGNVALSVDEILMYTEKLCMEFKEISYDLYLWAANILENLPCGDFTCADRAYEYYLKAIQSNPLEHEPYSHIIKLYNPELDLPPRSSLTELFDKGLQQVKLKSRYCQMVAEFYRLVEDPAMSKKYHQLSARYARTGR